MSKGPRLNVDQVAEINAMYSDGASGASIACALGVSISSVFRHVTTESVHRHREALNKATTVTEMTRGGAAVDGKPVDAAQLLAPLHKRIVELNKQKRIINEELNAIEEVLNAGVAAIASGYEQEDSENDA